MKDRPVQDTLQQIQTPEGIALNLRLAGIWPRSVAWIIDSLIRAGIYIVIGIISGQLERFGSGLFLISVFVIEWFYPVLFEVLNNGMTPGKKSLSLQVVNGDGTPVGWSSSMLRNILRTVDFLPLFYGLGLLTMLANDRFQRLGDLAADTLVVYRQDKEMGSHIPQAEPLAVPVNLDLKEQQSIISFAERSKQLSEERLQELAEILSPIKEGQELMSSAELIGMANGLIGRK